MAEAVVFSLASKILSSIVSHAFNKAHEKGVSILEAKDELVKLQESMGTIQAVLLDAEKRQESSAGVKNWIKRLKGLLYDAEDLFDEVATEHLLKHQMMEGKEKFSLKKKVNVSCFKLNPFVSRNSISKKIKAIRVSLGDITRDMAKFDFVRCQDEKSCDMGRGEDRGCFVDAKSVIGRDVDKKTMLEMLKDGPDIVESDNPIVLAIVGIGGMGKTTLAQLIYNDEEIRKEFKNRWFACISNTSDEREVLRKIFHSITGVSSNDLNIGQLQTKIRESIEGQKYLLILDDVWEDDRSIWQDRLNLLSSLARDSRIIVTTRLPSVAKAVGALRSHNLEGLSEDDSWSLFKRSAFVEEYNNDPRRESLGKRIMKKCSGVPLAIRSIGSLLYSKNTMAEWEAIEREDLPMLGRKYNDKTMSVLKLTYDHLPSHLKQCFAYCCLFPKDYEFSKQDLLNHWVSQGYIDPNDEESSFMHLLRRGFFQQEEDGDCGEVESCKMHDLMHDLAIYVAGEEIDVPSSTSSYASSCVRHVSFGISNNDESWDISALVLNSKLLRSLLLTTKSHRCTIGSVKLEQLFGSCKLLRTLSLSKLGIKSIPPSIAELKLLRYLDLSDNDFVVLPNSMSYLVNLLSLTMERCRKFEVWPLDFHKMKNLRYLNLRGCDELRVMPIGIGKMAHLQYLSDFNTEKGNESLNASGRLLQQLRGKLSIKFLNDVDGGICSWLLPVSLHYLEMNGYQGSRIPGWGNNGGTLNLTRLSLIKCTKVKYLPSLRCFPNLRWLEVRELLELEFMEVEDYIDHSNALYKFFPCLEQLVLYRLPKLKRCWSTLEEFPLLCELRVYGCPELELDSFPLCPHLQVLKVHNRLSYDTTSVIKREVLSASSPTPIVRCKWQSSLGSLQKLEIDNWSTLNSLHLVSPHLERMWITKCKELMSIEVAVANLSISHCSKLTSIEVVEPVTSIAVISCPELQNLRIASPNALEELLISYPVSSGASMDWGSISNLGECHCIREMYLQGVCVAFIEQLLSSSVLSLTTLCIKDEVEATSFLVWNSGIKWDSFPNLHKLYLYSTLEKLPQSLLRRQARGQLEISQDSEFLFLN